MRCSRQENKYAFKYVANNTTRMAAGREFHVDMSNCIFTAQRFSWRWLTCVDCASSGPQVDDPLRPAQRIGGRRSGRSDDAEILSLWRHRQRRQPHGVHRKTYVHVTNELRSSTRRHFLAAEPVNCAKSRFWALRYYTLCLKQATFTCVDRFRWFGRGRGQILLSV